MKKLNLNKYIKIVILALIATALVSTAVILSNEKAAPIKEQGVMKTEIKDSTTKKEIDYPAIWRDSKPGELVDSWGYRNRHCSSYVAYKAWKTFKIDVGHWGTGHGWLINAQQRGYTINNTPAKNAVIVYLFGDGHVQWIDYINADGTVHISQYDADTGKYSEQDFDATDPVLFPNGLNIIHFD